MKVLVACEESQEVTAAFIALGHDAMSCDLQPGAKGLPHYQGDVLDIINDGWDLMIAHPPCTYLSYAANHVWNKPGRAELREEAMRFFMACANAPIKKIAIENPVGYPNTVYRKPDQIIQPYFFGDEALKTTCLWLKGLPKLWYWKHDDLFGKRTATEYPKAVYATARKDGTVKLRHWTEAGHGGYARSKTFPGIARAMAEQWGM
ncbi:MAG: DNA cytosine methyltransferase [Chloroflexi bacterium]|nr:DNA cytosine methyltransferase [Chloroflexota bacterium]